MLNSLGERVVYFVEGSYEYIVSLIASIVSVAAAIFAVIRGIIFVRKEVRKIQEETDGVSADTDSTIADIMGKYEAAIERATGRAERVELKLCQLEENIAEKQKVINELMAEKDRMVSEYRERMTEIENEKRRMIAAFEAEIEDRDRQIRELVEWVERLVHQVRAFGGDPVPLRKGGVPSVEQSTRPRGNNPSRRRKKDV